MCFGATGLRFLFQEKEERLAKKRQAEQEAAKVYESFVSSFAGDDNAPKTFVRGEVRAIIILHVYALFAYHYWQTLKDGKTAAPSGGSTYKMHRAVVKNKPKSEMDRMLDEMMEKKKSRSSSRSALPSTNKPVKAIDSFLQELKQRAESGTQSSQPFPGMIPTPASTGSFDDGDPGRCSIRTQSFKRNDTTIMALIFSRIP